MIEVFKLMKGFDNIDYSDMFELSNTGALRGHCFKLLKPRFITNTGKFSFCNRVIDIRWNNLPEVVVSCNNVNSFKAKLDQVMKYDLGLK